MKRPQIFQCLFSITILFFVIACTNLNAGYRDGVIAYKNKQYGTAYNEFISLAEQGHANAQVFIGAMYELGNGVRKDHYEATNWYRKAAEQGNMVGAYNLGLQYYWGKGVLRNYYEAVKWIRKSAQKGYTKAEHSLGRMYGKGLGVPKDYYEAVKWYRKAAVKGYLSSFVSLGWYYQKGLGVPKDYDESIKWYRKAAEKGNSYGQLNLGFMYSKGLGITQDLKEAVRLYRLAAIQGNRIAQSNLGWMYLNGLGVIQDDYEAAKWYRKSAEKGHLRAQSNLGRMYEQGRGVSKDYYEAIKWYRKAAEKGYTRAQGNLGYMYLMGRGVRKDAQEGLRWLRKASSKKDSIAQGLIGFVYHYGLTGKKDHQLALYWYRKAYNNGNKRALKQIRKLDTNWQFAREQSPKINQSKRGRRDLVNENLLKELKNEIRSLREQNRKFQTRIEKQILESRLRKERLEKKRVKKKKFLRAGSGTAFFISSDGHLITNYHVVRSCNGLQIFFDDGRKYFAKLLASDVINDLALLKAKLKPNSFLTIRSSKLQITEDVLVSGYPFGRYLLGKSLTITKGIVSSLVGLKNNYSSFRFDAPINKGNSGGPVTDMNANVLGVTYLKLSPKVAKITKDYPENVNFAIKKSILSNFLDANNVNYSTREIKNLSPYRRANKLKNSTLYVSCIMTKARYMKLKKSRDKVLFENPEIK